MLKDNYMECYRDETLLAILLTHKIYTDKFGKHWFVYAYWNITGKYFAALRSESPLTNNDYTTIDEHLLLSLLFDTNLNKLINEMMF